MLYTIEKICIHTVKIRRSTFICAVSPANDLDAAKLFIADVSRQNKTATHNCWAYVIGASGQVFHSSDAGEPPGTAGKPMLQMLQKHHLTDIAAVVTRHFGGVKLGVRGLMDAYALSVQETVEKAEKVKKIQTFEIRVSLPYDFNDLFLAKTEPYRFQIADSQYAEAVSHTIIFDAAYTDEVTALLKGLRKMGKIHFDTDD